MYAGREPAATTDQNTKGQANTYPLRRGVSFSDTDFNSRPNSATRDASTHEDSNPEADYTSANSDGNAATARRLGHTCGTKLPDLSRQQPVEPGHLAASGPLELGELPDNDRHFRRSAS